MAKEITFTLTADKARALCTWIQHLDAGPTDFEECNPKDAERCRHAGEIIAARLEGKPVPGRLR